MSERLIILITNSNPHNPCEISEPIYYAAAAASMDYSVEVILSGQSGEVAIKGVAENIPSLKENKNIYDLIKEAADVGVIFKASKLLTLRWGDDLIPEVTDVVSAGYVISEAMALSTVTLTY